MPRRRTAAVVALSLLVGAGVTLLVGPGPPSLAGSSGSSDTGDPALAARVREVFGDAKGQRGVAVALLDADGATFAGVGGSGDPGRPQVDQDTRFEIGSVTKGLTGLLIAEQVPGVRPRWTRRSAGRPWPSWPRTAPGCPACRWVRCRPPCCPG